MKSLQRGLALFFGLFVFSVLLLNSVYLYVLLTCLGRQISLMGMSDNLQKSVLVVIKGHSFGDLSALKPTQIGDGTSLKNLFKSIKTLNYMQLLGKCVEDG